MGNKLKQKKLAILGLLVITLNLILGACGEEKVSVTPVSSSTKAGPLLPGLFGSPTPIVQTTAAVSVATPTVPSSATTVAPKTTLPQTSLPTVERFKASFASFNAQASNVKEGFPAYKLSSDLSNLYNPGSIELSDAQKKILASNSFVAEPTGFKQFYQLYENIRYYEVPVFVSTDSVAHVYHLLFDKVLRETEKQFLTKDLLSLTKALYNESLKQYKTLENSELAPAALRNLAFTAIAWKLADPAASLSLIHI